MKQSVVWWPQLIFFICSGPVHEKQTSLQDTEKAPDILYKRDDININSRSYSEPHHYFRESYSENFFRRRYRPRRPCRPHTKTTTIPTTTTTTETTETTSETTTATTITTTTSSPNNTVGNITFMSQDPQGPEYTLIQGTGYMYRSSSLTSYTVTCNFILSGPSFNGSGGCSGSFTIDPNLTTGEFNANGDLSLSITATTLSESFTPPNMASGSGRGSWNCSGSQYNVGNIYYAFFVDDPNGYLLYTTVMPTSTVSSG